MATDTLYEQDFVVWTERQAEALRHAARTGSNLPVDWENVAEEIESVGTSERSAVRSLIDHIVSHLLKLAHSPATRTRVGWEAEISYGRDMLRRKLESSPSLRPRLAEFLADEIPRARRSAARSLRRYGEAEAAGAAEDHDVSLTAEELLDEDFFLPGTRFGYGDD